MGRYATTFPWAFNQVPGDIPASRLDDDFEAVNDGVLTIRAQELSTGDDYNVTQDDEYSYFVCKGVSDFQVIPPNAPPAGFGFFLSNETRQNAVEIGVTICCTLNVGTVQYTNPELIRNFPPFFNNVKGGLVQYDGNDYNFYPLFFVSAGAITPGTVVVESGDTGVVITHGLSDASVVVTLLPQWNTQIYQTAQDATTVTFAFSNPVPSVSPPEITLNYLLVA